MDIKRYKITPHTSDTVRVEADKGYHFETLDGEYVGRIVYDGIGTRIENKYKIVLDNYLRPF